MEKKIKIKYNNILKILENYRNHSKYLLLFKKKLNWIILKNERDDIN
jgi:hypothetical protein